MADSPYRKLIAVTQGRGYAAPPLSGLWASAPYLHNGSVPTLAELLKPAAQRRPRFKVGVEYDLVAVGLAEAQPGAGVDAEVVTTGCENRDSGNSRCGHEYGTTLGKEEKEALLEYLKSL